MKADYDKYLIQQELDYEARETWAAAHCCGLCDDFDEDGPFKPGYGVCLKYSCEYKGLVDLCFVHEDEVHGECWDE